MGTDKITGQEIDVVIPVYNGERYILAALESVMAQTFLPTQLIVVDDGSTDATSQIIAGFIDGNKTSCKIIYVHKANGGLSSARNAGIGKCTSTFIALLDADDVWMPQKLAKQIDVIIGGTAGIGLVYCDYFEIDEHGETNPAAKVIHPLGNMRGRVFLKLLKANVISGSGSGVLIRRACFDRTGLFDERLKAMEDWDMWLRISKHYSFDFVPEALVGIRRHSASMQTDALHMLRNFLIFCKKWLKDAHDLKLVRKEWGHVIGELVLRAKDRKVAKELVTEVLDIGERRLLFQRTLGSLNVYLRLKRMRSQILKKGSGK